MKLNFLITFGVLSSALAAQLAPAQTTSVRNTHGIGVRIDWATEPDTISQTGASGLFKAGGRNNLPTGTPLDTLNPVSGNSSKIWLQFDISSVWATYDRANLASATLTLWGENGSGRSFDVSGLADSAAGQAWTAPTLSWYNAPGNNASSGYELDWTSTYNGAPLWQGRAGGYDLLRPTGSLLGTDYDQCSRYTSGDISAFLATDTDGLVTLILTDGPFNSNQNWWVGPAGSYDLSATYQTDLGEVLRDSPTLTLTFTPVPEPSVLALIAMSIGALWLRHRS